MPDVPAAVQSKASLPAVVLGSRPIPLNVLRFIPLEWVDKYQVCAFEINDSAVKLALVYPEQLKQGFTAALQDLSVKTGKKIILFRTDPASLHKVLLQYKEALNPIKADPTKVPPPPLFELGHTVVYNFLCRIPPEYAMKHHLICVDYLAPDQYWFVTDGINEDGLKVLLPALEEQNKIQTHLIKISVKDFNELRDYYVSLKKESDLKASSLRPSDEVTLDLPKSVPLAEGVVATDTQGAILASAEEVRGIAGLFQRVGQNMSAPQAEKNEPEVQLESQAVLIKIPVPAPEAKIVSSQEEKQPDQITVSVPQVASPQPSVVAEPQKSEPVPAPAEPQKSEPVPAPEEQQVIAVTPKAVKPDPTSHKPVASAEDDDIGKLLTKQIENVEELKEIVRKGFVPRIVAAIVSYGIHETASDIHIEAFVDEVRVRYRIDGQLIDIIKVAPEVHSAIVSRVKILAKMRLDETRVPQDGRFDVRFGSTQVDLRVSVMPTVHGEKVVMRILDTSRGVSSMESLGLVGRGYERLLHSIARPFGICLMTGPTGSGKSTSLYAILQRVSVPSVNIVTLEDPVEYEMKGVNQSQIRPKIGFTFAEGLRAVLRQDPNIIMVGEIRDGETALMATQAALTGHLVLSTLHTNDAAGAIPRLGNMGIEPFLIASSLNIVVAQRLVRRLCPDCKAEDNLPVTVLAGVENDLQKIEVANPSDAKRLIRPFKFYRGTGCPKCHGSGYLGRVGIYEVMESSEEIQELTLKHASASDIQAQAQKEGMITMYQDGLLKAIAGLTTLDEVLRESTNS